MSIRAKFGLAIVGLLASSELLAQVEVSSYFNTPGFAGAKSEVIPNQLVKLIDLAESGSSIRISIYDYDSLPISLALLRAGARGVDVRIAFDGENRKASREAGHPVNLLLAGAQGLPALKCGTLKCVHFCGNLFQSSCRGSRNNHNKFAIFSRLADGRKNVVALSSANWNDTQLYWYNDLIVLANDARLYSGMMAYYGALVDPDAPIPVLLVGDHAIVHDFPNPFSDPVLDLLMTVSCDLPGSKIRVIESRFTDDRVSIATRLKDLSAQGCDVEVLARYEPSMKSPGRKVSAALGPLLRVLPYEAGENHPESRNTTHAKVIALEASLNGSTRKQLVLTGSHNLNRNSLERNDELLIEIRGNRELLDAYLGFYDRTIADAIAAGYSP